MNDELIERVLSLYSGPDPANVELGHLLARSQGLDMTPIWEELSKLFGAAKPGDTPWVLLNSPYLRRSRSLLTRLSPVVRHLPLLRDLSLQKNLLSELPESLCLAPSLERIDLSNNLFDTFPEVLLRCPALKRLYLRDNRLKSLPEACLHMEGWERFDILSNTIETLPPTLQTLYEQLCGEAVQVETQIPAYFDINALNEELTALSLKRFGSPLPPWVETLVDLAWRGYLFYKRAFPFG